LKKNKFNFLSDQSVDSDSFDDKTHYKVAESIVKLIECNKSKAVTIGLEGRWGSGKSTIIAILQNLISGKKDQFQYLYIDAWAHEGDPLRRIFLENIIQQIDPKENDSELKNIKYILSKRKKNITTNTTKAPTKTGCIIAILTLMVPFGAAMLSTINISEVSFLEFTKPIYWKFIISSIFSLLPVLYIMGRFIFVWKKNGFKKAKDIKNWAFVGENTKDTITQEISEENERSSIEFEKYFHEILKIILLNNKKDVQEKQIILVIDNLDRINAQDSLKIWSTIQTFLQYKNPNNNNNDDISKNLWVIVPYDESGLGKLWDNSNYLPENQQNSVDGKKVSIQYDSDNKNYIKECGKLQKRSFFDKCFQLRFEIPFTVQTSWENFAKKLINESLTNLNQNEKNIVLSILINSRESLADIPSPREIKTYINQIGIQSILSNENITIDCISYYVYLKYHKQLTQDEIKQGLLETTIPYQKHKSMLPDDAQYQLSGILFGTSQKKGKQLLLEAPILEALNDGNSQSLFNLYEDHVEGFWSIYDIVITKYKNNPAGMYKIDLLASTHAIYGEMWKDSKLLPHFEKIMKEIKKTVFNYPTLQNYIYYQSFFDMFKSDKDALKNIWQNILDSFGKHLEKLDFKADEFFKIYNNICNDFPKEACYEIIVESENLENWCKWAQNFSNEYIYVIPSESNISKLSEKVTAGVAVEDKYIALMKYCLRAYTYDLKPLIDKIITNISWNNGNQSANKISNQLLDVIIGIAIYSTKNNEDIKSILKNSVLYNFLSYESSYFESFALLIAIYWPNDIPQFSYSNNPINRSATALNSIKQIWLNNNLDICNKLMIILSKYNQENIIWKLPIEQTKQIKNILINAMENGDSKYFIIKDDCYKKYKDTINILDTLEEKNKFTHLILSNNPIKDSIINIENEFFFDDLNYLYLIYINCQSTDKIKDFYKNGFIDMTKEQWLKILKEENLSKITIDLINKNVLIGNKLKFSFYQAIYEYLEEWVKGEINPIEYVLNNWNNLVLNLEEPFYNRIGKFSEEILWNDFEFIESNIKIFSPIDLDEIKHGKINNYIEKMLVKEECFSEMLNKIFMVLEIIQSIPIDEEFNKVVSSSLIRYISTSNDEDKSKIKFIATKIGITENVLDED
jgi:ABC-type dipeptide/oligopeptide/nickel transport system ATPase subunit